MRGGSITHIHVDPLTHPGSFATFDTRYVLPRQHFYSLPTRAKCINIISRLIPRSLAFIYTKRQQEKYYKRNMEFKKWNTHLARIDTRQNICGEIALFVPHFWYYFCLLKAHVVLVLLLLAATVRCASSGSMPRSAVDTVTPSPASTSYIFSSFTLIFSRNNTWYCCEFSAA